jgi:hypothetical protein
MQIKLLFISLFLMTQCAFSQTKKQLVGKVVCKNLPVVADIVNPNSKQMMVTNDQGEFSIVAKAGDVLVFIANDYEYHRVELTQEDINKNNLVITLTKKSITLKEVVIKKNTVAPKISTNTQKYVDQKYAPDQYTSQKNKLIYDGTIENGIDFMRLGKDIIKLFKSKKGKDKKKVTDIDFKEFSTSTFSESFFTKNLELDEDEVALFLEFCAADPKSKLIVDEKNIVGVMDFYITKKNEFKKVSLETIPVRAK